MVESSAKASAGPGSSPGSTPPKSDATAQTGSAYGSRKAETVGSRPRDGWGVRHLVASVVRLADLQLRIWLTRVKMAVLRAALFSALFAISLLLALLAVIFLFIGAFRVLTDVAGLRPVWAFLIFGGGMLLLAAIMAGIGVKLLSGMKSESSETAHRPRAGGTERGAGA